jgi:hypothetical protein
MTARILVAAFIALAAILGAHLAPLLLTVATIAIGGTALVLLERITTTVLHTGWGCAVTRGGAAW